MSPTSSTAVSSTATSQTATEPVASTATSPAPVPLPTGPVAQTAVSQPHSVSMVEYAPQAESLLDQDLIASGIVLLGALFLVAGARVYLRRLQLID